MFIYSFNMKTLLLLVFLCVFERSECLQLDILLQRLPPKTKCERITISMCQDFKYNFTIMPNLMGNKSQKEAEEAMTVYAPLLASDCSPHARFFLCSAFAPLCSEDVSGGVGGCRALCEKVQSSCAEVLAKLPPLDCARFPDAPERKLCMRPPNASELAPPTTEIITEVQDAQAEVSDVMCPPLHKRGPSGECVPACKRLKYRPDEKKYAEAWITAAAWASLLSTTFASLAFRADRSRFRYPERPVVFAAGCHAVVALTYLIKGWVGDKEPVCGLGLDGLPSGPCIAFFAVTYYFTLAADAWFANACVAWYLSAACEWSTEALERAGAYFHAAAWGWAGAWTAAAIALRRVASDELTGVCRVADDATAALIGVPRGALLGAALALGACAAPGVMRVRRALDGGGAKRVGRLAARAVAAGIAYWAVCVSATAAAVAIGGGNPFVQAAQLAGGCAAGAWAWSGKSWRVCTKVLRTEERKPLPAPIWRAHYPPLMHYRATTIARV